MVLRPDTTGEMLKWKVIVVLPFVTTTEAAGAPLILKSLAWTVDGSTGLLTFTTKSLGRVKMVIPHQGAGCRTRRGGWCRYAIKKRNDSDD